MGNAVVIPCGTQYRNSLLNPPDNVAGTVDFYLCIRIPGNRIRRFQEIRGDLCCRKVHILRRACSCDKQDPQYHYDRFKTLFHCLLTGSSTIVAACARTILLNRSEEHTSELQSLMAHLVCRLLLEKKKT